MKESLMLYVEPIVRPVHATQGRKLRMRTELLAHLQAALDEERERFPCDENAAFERAKLRLGEPGELTRELQQAVPTLERALLGRLPLSPGLEHLEQQMARVPGKHGSMTLGHIVILSALATLAAMPLFTSMYSALKTSDMQTAHSTLASVGMLLGWLVLLPASYRFVFELAGPDDGFDWPGTLKHGAMLFALQMGLAFFTAFAIADRCATMGEVMACAASTLALLSVSAFIARRIGVLRRPYDEWLNLNLIQ